MISISAFVKVIIIAASLRQKSVFCFNSAQFDEIVLIEDNLALVFNASKFWVWYIDERIIEPVEHATTGFDLHGPIEFIWVPYVERPQVTEEQFEQDYGKVCINSQNENILYHISYDPSFNLLQIVRSQSNHCADYILIHKESTCTLTIFPILQNNLNLLARYSSLFLVGHDKYSYIIFDRKYEYIQKNRLIAIKYRFNYTNDNFTNLAEPMCLDILKRFIMFKKITHKKITGLKSIMPLSDGNIYIFFNHQYCIINLGCFLQCDKRNTEELFTVRRSKRDIQTKMKGNTEKLTNVTKITSTMRPERKTSPTSTNEIRAAIMILAVFGITILVILSYKLILVNRNN